MATKIRLARHGKKGKPYYHIVVADARAKRDGRYIERIGSYNPNVNPASINVNFDKALDWILKGAQPTDTVRAMLSYKGVLYKKHLLGGVKKGALTQEQVEEKFTAWLNEKEVKIEGKKEQLSKDAKDKIEKSLLAEKEKNEARAKLFAEEAAKLEAEANAETAEETVEETAEETVEAKAEETVEAKAEETVEVAETNEEEKKEESK